ncbi:reverse transcriptase [Plakobranchus ocellatus]|uniref:Reverse transcriptase n=1 Tax=Plakobranchus ocellatus TaxID=259542 RepID=A0AAV4DRI5_9GAST|nr:reverse transcriptase [Plakobranchus ocellatus]
MDYPCIWDRQFSTEKTMKIHRTKIKFLDNSKDQQERSAQADKTLENQGQSLHHAKYLTENGYVDVSVQKGGLPGVLGCHEHATMIWKAIQRAKLGQCNLDVVLLDLANAYTQRVYHIPEDSQEMLEDYFNGFKMRFSTEKYTIYWIILEISADLPKWNCSITAGHTTIVTRPSWDRIVVLI